MSALLHDPATIASYRRQLFELKDEITLSSDDWEAIWPYIDNIWVERNASRAKDRQQFNCRIWRNDSDKKAGSGQRNRVRRDVEPCGMKMYVVKRGDGVVISRCPGRTTDVKNHNHDLQYIDKVKTPSGVMKIAAAVMKDGKTPSEAVKDVKSLSIVQALEQDGGLFIDSNRVRNAYKASVQGTPNGMPAATPRRAATGSNFAAKDERNNTPMKVTCQCGEVQLFTPGKPLDLYHCHCTECQKQSGSAFGTSAIYPALSIFPLSPELAQKLTVFERPIKDGGVMSCYFCTKCGSRIFHHDHDTNGTPKATVSVKGGVIEGLDWSGASHIWTKSAVIPIPAHARKWRESPEIVPPRPADEHPLIVIHDAMQVHNATAGAKDTDPTINPNLPMFTDLPFAQPHS